MGAIQELRSLPARRGNRPGKREDNGSSLRGSVAQSFTGPRIVGLSRIDGMADFKIFKQEHQPVGMAAMRMRGGDYIDPSHVSVSQKRNKHPLTTNRLLSVLTSSRAISTWVRSSPCWGSSMMVPVMLTSASKRPALKMSFGVNRAVSVSLRYAPQTTTTQNKERSCPTRFAKCVPWKPLSQQQDQGGYLGGKRFQRRAVPQQNP